MGHQASVPDLDDLRRQAIDEVAVVRDEHHRPGEAGQRVLEHVPRREIQVVGRLVETQEGRGAHEHAGEGEPRLLASREDRHALLDGVPREEERAEERPEARPVGLGRGRFHLLQDRARRVERVELVLGVVVRRHVRAQDPLARVRREDAREDPEERRFPGAVRPDERDAIAALEVEIDPRVDDLRPVRLGDPPELGDVPAGPRAARGTRTGCDGRRPRPPRAPGGPSILIRLCTCRAFVAL